LIGGGLVRSMGGWSRVLSLRGSGEEVAHDSRILGSGDFVQAVIREAEEGIARQMRSRRKERSIERVIKEMCKEAGVKEQEVCGGIRGRRISEERGRIAYCLNREIGLSMAETARRLGVGTSAIGMAIKRRDSREGNR